MLHRPLKKHLAAMAVVLPLGGGCASAVGTFEYGGQWHRMESAQGRYLDQSLTRAAEQEREWRAGGKSDLEVASLKCELLKGTVAGAPKPGNANLTSAASLLEAERRSACTEHKNLTWKNSQEDRLQQARAVQAERQVEAEKLAHEREQEEQRNLQRKAELQATSYRIGSLECTVVDYVSLGSAVGNLATTEASGVYLAVLLRCLNRGKKTARVSANDVALEDGTGRQFSIDTEASLYYVQEIDDGQKSLISGVQHHPGVKTYSVAVFDAPNELLEDSDAKLVFRKAEFPLARPGHAD